MAKIKLNGELCAVWYTVAIAAGMFGVLSWRSMAAWMTLMLALAGLVVCGIAREDWEKKQKKRRRGNKSASHE